MQQFFNRTILIMYGIQTYYSGQLSMCSLLTLGLYVSFRGFDCMSLHRHKFKIESVFFYMFDKLMQEIDNIRRFHEI